VPYQLNTPWNNETWTDNNFSPYSRLAGKRIQGGTPNGVIGVSLTDIARGITLLVNGSVVTENRTPSQDDLSDADAYYLGGHEYTISDSEAAILIAAGYSSYLTLVP
jgi:hypothetical protein